MPLLSVRLRLIFWALQAKETVEMLRNEYAKIPEGEVLTKALGGVEPLMVEV